MSETFHHDAITFCDVWTQPIKPLDNPPDDAPSLAGGPASIARPQGITGQQNSNHVWHCLPPGRAEYRLKVLVYALWLGPSPEMTVSSTF